MNEFTPAVQDLIDHVNAGLQEPLEVVIDGPASGVLRATNGDSAFDDQGNLHIIISDTTDVDYTLSHELWHVLLPMLGFPETGTAVHTANKMFNDQMRAIAGGLESVVIHRLIAGWQDEAGMLTHETKVAIRKGIQDDTPVEEGTEDDGQILLRVFNILDGLILLGGPDSDMISAWYRQYPMALEMATKLFGEVADADLSNPRNYRTVIVKLFDKFNAVMAAVDLELDFAGFIIVPPVVSERQLRLSMNQLFQLENSVYESNKPHTTAYTALGLNDGQGAFVLQLDKNQTKPEYFQSLYAKPLSEVLEQFGIGYTLR